MKGVSWLLQVQTENEKNTYSIQNVFFLPTDKVGTSISQGHDKKQKYPQAPMFLFNIVPQFIISSQGVQCAGDFVSVDLFFTERKYMQNP